MIIRDGQAKQEVCQEKQLNEYFALKLLSILRNISR
jgi:hypothetical protein